MGGHRRHPGIDQDVNRIIAFKARRMARQPEFRDHEIADLQQILWEAWFKVEDSFDPADGTITQFADVVLNNCISKLRESQRAQKRAWWLCRASLDDPVDVEDETGLNRHDVYDRNDYFRQIGEDPWPIDRMAIFNTRLNRVLPKLSPPQREFVLRLMAGECTTDIAAAMGVHRSTLYAWRKAIQCEFRKVGLDAFLPSWE